MEIAIVFKSFVTLFAIINPAGSIPVFASMTADWSSAARRKAAIVAAAAVFATLTVALIAGTPLLAFFGVSIASFRVGGGVLIFLMAISMLHGKISGAKHTEEEAEEAATRNSIAVVPIGIPLLAGPGAISTIILLSQEPQLGGFGPVILTAEIALVAIIVWLCLLASDPIAKAMGKTGLNIFTRVFGLILCAMGVEILAAGLKALFPVLGGS